MAGNGFKSRQKGLKGFAGPSLFYDLNRGKILLFGGENSKGRKKNEMWEWNGDVWNKVSQGERIPEPRSNLLISYDENRRRAVVFGGSGKAGVLDDLWEWDGNQWDKIEVQGEKPNKREVYGITYHKILKKIFLFGGRTGFAKPLEIYGVGMVNNGKNKKNFKHEKELNKNYGK